MAVAILVAAVTISEAVNPAAPLLHAQRPATLAEAITSGLGPEAVYRFLRAGQDPNALVQVHDPNYVTRPPVAVSPLVLAVAARRTGVAQMLLAFGARLDLPQNRVAWCVARESRNDELQSLLVAADASVKTTACPEPNPQAEAPLDVFAPP